MGIVVALVFVGIPFVVRSVQPVLEKLDALLRRAPFMGADNWHTFRRVIWPEIRPAALTGWHGIGLGLGEYGSVVFIAGNKPYATEIAPLMIMGQLQVLRLRRRHCYRPGDAGRLLFLILLLMNIVQARRPGGPAAKEGGWDEENTDETVSPAGDPGHLLCSLLFGFAPDLRDRAGPEPGHRGLPRQHHRGIHPKAMLLTLKTTVVVVLVNTVWAVRRLDRDEIQLSRTESPDDLIDLPLSVSPVISGLAFLWSSEGPAPVRTAGGSGSRWCTPCPASSGHPVRHLPLHLGK